jgi:hypothetical protein
MISVTFLYDSSFQLSQRLRTSTFSQAVGLACKKVTIPMYVLFPFQSGVHGGGVRSTHRKVRRECVEAEVYLRGVPVGRPRQRAKCEINPFRAPSSYKGAGEDQSGIALYASLVFSRHLRRSCALAALHWAAS